MTTTIIMTAIIITFGLDGCWCLMAHNGKILAKGGENSTTDELCRNVDKSANAHFNYRLPAFCQYIVSCRFSSAYNLTK